ncbi:MULTISPECIES: hypothetical protein [Proteus]|uniref:hypothetical protein n=1 Tax=Proteus TaxID=583 RepID=UPI001E57392A|nr:MULTISPECIES: hypothetical protein [Proteus]MCE9840170.1 hypothetical protein [Proteus terrae]MCS6715121.1 hypothetical protein [Proteus terrae]MDR9743293.1 hypothetical protein [Proteus terrae]
MLIRTRYGALPTTTTTRTTTTAAMCAVSRRLCSRLVMIMGYLSINLMMCLRVIYI